MLTCIPVKWTVGFTLRPTKSTKYAWEWPDWVYLPSCFEMDINRRTYFSNRLLKLTNIEDTPILIISSDALANSAFGYQTPENLDEETVPGDFDNVAGTSAGEEAAVDCRKEKLFGL